jgi:hypothetical protein
LLLDDLGVEICRLSSILSLLSLHPKFFLDWKNLRGDDQLVYRYCSLTCLKVWRCGGS